MALVQSIFKVSSGDREFLERNKKKITRGAEGFGGSGGWYYGYQSRTLMTLVIFQKKMMMGFIFILFLISRKLFLSFYCFG